MIQKCYLEAETAEPWVDCEESSLQTTSAVASSVKEHRLRIEDALSQIHGQAEVAGNICKKYL